MSCHPDIHRRRSTRLSDYNYSLAGAYFVTICTFQRECLFGGIIDGGMRLNEYGMVVQRSWDDLPDHFRHVELDQFAIMPNHVHGIIVLTDVVRDDVGARHASPGYHCTCQQRATHASPLPSGPKPHSIGAIVGSFKSAVTKHINILRQTPAHPVWQRNYYEHIIRDDRDLAAIRQYIADNPAKWADDENYPGVP